MTALRANWDLRIGKTNLPKMILVAFSKPELGASDLQRVADVLSSAYAMVQFRNEDPPQAVPLLKLGSRPEVRDGALYIVVSEPIQAGDTIHWTPPNPIKIADIGRTDDVLADIADGLQGLALLLPVDIELNLV